MGDALGQDDAVSLPDNHLSLIEEVTTAYEASFFDIVARYDARLKTHPDDAVAATEKCHFIAYFSYSEDFYIEETEALLEESETYLDRFENEPLVEMYRFGELWGEEEIEVGEALLANEALDLSPQQEAVIHLDLSYRYTQVEKRFRGKMHSIEAHRKDPSIQSQLDLARHHVADGQEEKALRLLQSDVSDEFPYLTQQRMTLLAELGDTESALRLLRELRKSGDDLYSAMDQARVFASAGQLEEARAAFDQASENAWQREATLMERFEFERAQGDDATSLAAYNLLRDEGFSTDPFLYYRLGLFKDYPHLPWRGRDALGVLMLIGTLLALLLIPLLWIFPIHYWGLIRQIKGKPSLPVSPSWRLKHTWRVSALYLITGFVISYFLAYDFFYKDFFADTVEEVEIPSLQLARLSILTAFVPLLLVGFLIGYRRTFRSLGTGDWTLGKCIGFAIVAYLPLRFFAGINIGIAEGIESLLAAETTLTIQGIMATLEHYGPWILILSLAVITPIVEEILFRGVLLTSFMRHIPFWWANGIQATLFTLAHDQIAVFPFLFAFGMVTGYLRRASGSLLPGTILHAINNGFVAIGVIIAGVP